MAVGSARHRGAGRRGWGWSSVRVGAFSTGCGDRSAAEAGPSTTRHDQGRAHALRMENPLEGRRLPRRVSERHRPAARLMRFLCCGSITNRGVAWRPRAAPADRRGRALGRRIDVGHPEGGGAHVAGGGSSVRGRRLRLPRALPWEVGGDLRRRRSDPGWDPRFIFRLVGLRAPSGAGHRSEMSARLTLGRSLSAVMSGCRVGVGSGAVAMGRRMGVEQRGRATRLGAVAGDGAVGGR